MASIRNNESPEESFPKRRKINRIYARSIDQQVEDPHNKIGSISTEICGTIERIILKNVFCHEYLDFDGFKTSINLLQGANGSGKSSIVASIIAGLGGTSKNTDRAKNLKSMIQNGKQWANIEIHLKNNGKSPYKTDIYGDKIIVERRILSSGSSSYKIKSSNGCIVATKREDLSRILDWYNFQVDNPVLILSQERAKTFLSSTNPRSLFEFYFTATQLRQSSNILGASRKDISSMEKCIQQKEENLPVLKREVKQWEMKVEAIKTLDGKRKSLSDLRKAKAWAEVIEYEVEVTKMKQKDQKIQKSLTDLQNKVTEYEAEKKTCAHEESSCEKNLVQLAEKCKTIEEKRSTATKVLTDVKSVLREKTGQLGNLKKEAHEKGRDVTTLKEKLVQDGSNDEARAKWQEENEKLSAEKAALEEKEINIEHYLETARTHRHNLFQSLNEARENKTHCLAEENALASRISSLKREQNSLKGQKENISVFGQYMPRLLQEINNAASRNFFQNKPIGPIGSYIKAKDKNWVHIVEKIVGNMFSSFICGSRRDQECLSKIFTKVLNSREKKPPVIVAPFRNKIHDVKQYETKTNIYQSLWSVIETDNVQVANALIDQLQIESILLVPSADEANDLLIDSRTVPQNCKKAITLNGDIYFPDPNFRLYSGTGDRKARFLQVSVEDRIRDLELNIQSVARELEKSRQESSESKLRFEELANEEKKASEKMKKYENDFRVFRRQMQDIKNKEQALKDIEKPLSLDVYQLQKDLQEAEELREQVDEKIKESQESIKDVRSKVDVKEKSLKLIQSKVAQITETVQEVENKMKEIQMNRMQKEKAIKAYMNKRTEIEKLDAEHSKTLKEKESQIDNKIKELLKVSPERIQPNKSRNELERDYAALEKVIQRQEAVHGDLESIHEGWKSRKERYESIRDMIIKQRNYINDMTVSLDARQKKFKNARKLQEVMFKSSFKSIVKKRNLVGNVSFDYKKETLSILMRKDTGNKDHELQSIQMMSGGERSFATVSFILSLWDFIGSPVRILDEFDIFMDVVSRTQCVDTIVDAAKRHIQYIMVSPLEYRKKSDKLQIFRMPDPERKKRYEESEEI